MRYRLIATHTEYSAAKWAEFLHVSRSGYQEWKRSASERARKRAAYVDRVNTVFQEGEGAYGAQHICGELRKRGYRASFDKVQSIMREQGLFCAHWRCRHRKSLTDSRKARTDGYANLVRGTKITEPMQVLSSDISYIRTGEGFEYLCQIKDVVSGMVLSHSTSARMKKELVLDTLRGAICRWALPEGCIFHSDRGSQYTSEAVKKFLARHRIRQSFSRIGKPGDNAWSESFFANLKKERIHWVHFATREEAVRSIFGYIEGFYNTRRTQERLGYLSPMQWLKRWEREKFEDVA